MRHIHRYKGPKFHAQKYNKLRYESHGVALSNHWRPLSVTLSTNELPRTASNVSVQYKQNLVQFGMDGIGGRGLPIRPCTYNWEHASFSLIPSKLLTLQSFDKHPTCHYRHVVNLSALCNVRLRKQLIQLVAGTRAGEVSFVGEKGFNETRNLPFGAIEWGHLVEVNDPDSWLAVSCRVACDVCAENDLDIPRVVLGLHVHLRQQATHLYCRIHDIDAKQFGAVTGEGEVVGVEKSLWRDSSGVGYRTTEENASQMGLASCNRRIVAQVCGAE